MTASELENAVDIKLWEPQDVEHAQMYKFIQRINKKYGKSLDSYDTLYDWSINNISDFWEEVWDYTGMVGTRFTKVCLTL